MSLFPDNFQPLCEIDCSTDLHEVDASAEILKAFYSLETLIQVFAKNEYLAKFKTLILSQALYNYLKTVKQPFVIENDTLEVTVKRGNFISEYTLAVLCHTNYNRDNIAHADPHFCFSHHSEDLYREKYLPNEAALTSTARLAHELNMPLRFTEIVDEKGRPKRVKQVLATVEERDELIGSQTISCGSSRYDIDHMDFDEVVRRVSAGETIDQLRKVETNPPKKYWVGNKTIVDILAMSDSELITLIASFDHKPILLLPSTIITQKINGITEIRAVDNQTDLLAFVEPGTLVISRLPSGAWTLITKSKSVLHDEEKILMLPQYTTTDIAVFIASVAQHFPKQEILMAVRLLAPELLLSEIDSTTRSLESMEDSNPAWIGLSTDFKSNGAVDARGVQVENSFGVIHLIPLVDAKE